jgi:hypothetical protein
MNWKRFGGRQSWVIRVTIHDFAWRNWWKSRRASVGIAGVLDEFRTQYLLNRFETYVCIYLWLYSPLLDLGRFSVFCLIFYTVSRTPWTGDQPVARPLPGRRTAQTQNKHTQTSMSQLGFEPTIPAFEILLFEIILKLPWSTGWLGYVINYQPRRTRSLIMFQNKGIVV